MIIPCYDESDSISAVIRVNGRVIEIPVSYYGRKGGESKHSGSFRHGIRTGLKMLDLIFQKRLNLS